ncbi:unnamed protein product, partial [Anisakis simplex]|uniref:Uncharacterized protein n=1 Tax=Anisakis simplex TaxID=6269 RepID=A0A0M3J944_ANISI
MYRSIARRANTKNADKGALSDDANQTTAIDNTNDIVALEGNGNARSANIEQTRRELCSIS